VLQVGPIGADVHGHQPDAPVVVLLGGGVAGFGAGLATVVVFGRRRRLCRRALDPPERSGRSQYERVLVPLLLPPDASAAAFLERFVTFW
jgi:hypothetical protein